MPVLECKIAERDWLGEVDRRNGEPLTGDDSAAAHVPDAGPWEPIVQQSMHGTDPVDHSEFVYRRIHPTFFNDALPVPVLFEAFRPTRNDVSGLSVIRALFAKPQDTLAGGDPNKVVGYYIARLSVSALD